MKHYECSKPLDLFEGFEDMSDYTINVYVKLWLGKLRVLTQSYLVGIKRIHIAVNIKVKCCITV